MTAKPSCAAPDTDAIVVGAGFAGLYLIHRLKSAGLRIRVFEAAPDLGGTWYWNRYPGACVDVPSLDYMFSFDPDWRGDWQWSEKYATQPEILRYLNHVADKHDLRRHITFDTRVERAWWDDDLSVWHVCTQHDPDITARFLVMATGCLSMPKEIDIDGVDLFTGDVFLTSRWPHEPVDFTGKRVAVVGTGSSGVQSIPVIARDARQVVVFQRTPTFSIAASIGPVPADKLAKLSADEAVYRLAARTSQAGVPVERSQTMTAGVSRKATGAQGRRCLRVIDGRPDLVADELGELFVGVGIGHQVGEDVQRLDQLALLPDLLVSLDAIDRSVPNDRAWTAATTPPTTCRM
jgi:cation diffusion facilitator CzcD-associated flavoprotein CzcO